MQAITVSREPSFDGHLFLKAVQRGIFGHRPMTPEQRASCVALLERSQARGASCPRALAYALATATWETGGALRPLEETAESPFRGRGFVCASGEDFYARASDLCGVDLVAEPDKLLDPNTAADVLLAGLEAGAFTGESISSYFSAEGIDWVGARRTVGDMTQAHRIAGLARAYWVALQGSKVH
jgi:hypothetical protein